MQSTKLLAQIDQLELIEQIFTKDVKTVEDVRKRVKHLLREKQAMAVQETDPARADRIRRIVPEDE